MIGELIINQSLIDQYVAENYPHDNRFITNMGGLSRTTRELQDLSMFLRMVPLKPTFQKITRIARDTIQELGKDVDFSTSGESTEIDRVVTDKLLDPLVHLIKNAISHGVEPDVNDRIASGKSAKATVEIVAYNKRGSIYIEIRDDGRGINTDVVYKKALEKGLIDGNREYTEEEIKEFILLPGFSTAEKVDNISGRGVGMDVVKTQIQKLGGRLDIKSELGKGSVFTLKIPVNHAIMNGTVIEMLGQQFIVPTLNVKEILQPTENHWISTQQKRTMLRVRENIVPIVPVDLLFSELSKDSKEASPLVLLLESEGEFRAFPITNVLNRQEVVVKPVGEEFSDLKYISGMSILGNGKVSLILDVDYLFTMEAQE
jgi:two-component system chemotaxis sensor kinase CheA